jgi:hypothetical protein
MRFDAAERGIMPVDPILAGHGMQGATVERAIVVASPPDLTAGWSYTALSRARGETKLVICECREDRTEIAPLARTPHTRAELIARVERRMRERDDEDLAIEHTAELAGWLSALRGDVTPARPPTARSRPSETQPELSVQTE